MFLLPESPAHYVRELHVWIGGYSHVSKKFFKYAPWFMNAERMFLLGMRTPLFWRLPQSVTSLTINTDLGYHGTAAQLNLDNLSLSGYLIRDAGGVLVGIGTALRGRFGGKLLLHNDCADNDVMNMLLEITSGLRFTAVHIRCGGECLLATLRFVEACSKTLVKLSYMVTLHGKCHSSFWPSRF